jgi:hypothetical protein
VVFRYHFDLTRSSYVAFPCDQVDLVPFEKSLNPATEFFDDPLIAADNLVEVGNRSVATQTKCLGVAHLLKENGAFVHGFSWNATPVEAGTPNKLFFNNADFGTQLSSTNSSNVASRSGA